MNEIMIYELKNLMKNAKPALEIAHYHDELPTFVKELNGQVEPTNMSIQYMFEPLVAVTSNYIISGEARKCQKDVAEFSERVMRTIANLDMFVDIKLTNPADMIFSMLLYQNGLLVVEITA